MANRKEFGSKVRKQALTRSGMVCEAIGDWYGLPEGQRCARDLAYGVEYDHYILDANSKDNSLENCRAVCPDCHKWKTANRDTPLAAKTVAQSLMGMKTRVKVKIPQRPKSPKPNTPKPVLPWKAMYGRIEP
ncbi:HNH endonuclease signature motif containing protein [Mesorhizobium sp. M4B.F.Ca.ET.143.01.1.1]|uniref:HNH endonuclease n=1 Tax=Mesorhizobium sp. M4B.F.Ca.ET.143.01.1.1 TaxID=2563947 RepID=UPI0010940E39|nr:HNH endonuclease signature motif containing protein [Mesorhizobium sp. M4B.F.Ca.ET.143.01.1.1]TGV26368.1 HNH endonuclease [Mesorhizobium sp. M4B.F.Ca.ET.143.01.1.1]